MTPPHDVEGGQGGQIEEAPAWAQEIMLRLQAVELRTREVAKRTARATPLEGRSALNQITPWVAALMKTQPEPDKGALQGLMNQLSNAYDDPEDAKRATFSTKACTKSKNKEKKALKFQGRCYNCQQDGHMARDCLNESEDEPLKKLKTAPAGRTKKSKAAPTNSTKKTGAKPKVEELSKAESDTSKDSGKEEL
ncbi:hypothetical protein VE00_04304 [Pseudogymnoascus sp. WSF 3629]|nr:hypothetical protein VE00_04304 [Pseudogymnoascus sp. WSF 3629]